MNNTQTTPNVVTRALSERSDRTTFIQNIQNTESLLSGKSNIDVNSKDIESMTFVPKFAEIADTKVDLIDDLQAQLFEQNLQN